MARALLVFDMKRLAALLLGLLLLCIATGASAQTLDAAAVAACTPGMKRSDPQCAAAVRKADEPVARSMGASYWLRPLGTPGPREPAAGSLLATICLAWLVLLAIATVVRPRGWRHKPLFGALRRGSAGRSA